MRFFATAWLVPATIDMVTCRSVNRAKGPIINQNAAFDPSAPIDPLLRDKEAARLIGTSVPTFWRRVADGTIPKPLKLGGMSRWPRSEILEAIERLKAKRGVAASAAA